jgi:hypothetical protein
MRQTPSESGGMPGVQRLACVAQKVRFSDDLSGRIQERVQNRPNYPLSVTSLKAIPFHGEKQSTVNIGTE